MDDKRKQILVDYISYLYTTGKNYDSIGKYIKYVTDFLESAEEINRRGYLKYKHKNADAMVRHSFMCAAVCDLLSYLKIGYGRREKAVKPLEKLEVISEKNKKLLHDFIIWLTDNNDFAILFASNSECVYCEFINGKIEYIDCELDCEICQFEGRLIFQYINGSFHNPTSQIIELSKLLMKGELKDTKSIFCSMVLRLMDTEEYSNNYCKSLDLVLRLFPEIDGELLEKELDRYI